MIIRFAKEENGASFVEFGIMLPMLVLLFGACVEGARTFWSYQTTLTGVREAARYLSRVVDSDVCAKGGSTQGWNDELTTIVRNSLTGESLLPSAVSVTGVVSSLSCSGGGFRGGLVSVATVTASLTINYPFSGLITQDGTQAAAVKTKVTDSARMLGR